MKMGPASKIVTPESARGAQTIDSRRHDRCVAAWWKLHQSVTSHGLFSHGLFSDYAPFWATLYAANEGCAKCEKMINDAW
jgi:hypothetical protein